MARLESDREDLLGEAVALVERIELSPSECGSAADDTAIGLAPGPSIVVGFRAGGAASFFFGADPVYQFNTSGALRRAYCDGQLFKAVGGRLVSLARIRTASEVTLRSRELSLEQQHEFLARAQLHLEWLATLLATKTYSITAQVPVDANIVARIEHWLITHREIVVALAPNVAP